jgi:hypothetical protein
MKEILKKSFDKNFIKDKIIYDYNKYIKIYIDYKEKDKFILFNIITDTSIQGYSHEIRLNLINKFLLTQENQKDNIDIGLFKIL